MQTIFVMIGNLPIQANKCFIIIPVHNRKHLTLNCLNHLDNQNIFESYQVVVVDDGSTDGTSEAITLAYPQVHLLHGNGNLWWTGAITLGMQYAYRKGAEYFIWLNDDTLPKEHSLSLLVSVCSKEPKRIVAGQCYSPNETSQPTYGAFRHSWLRHEALNAETGQLLECDSVNGNLVCLPRSVVSDIGYLPEKKAPHYHGETIYTWEAKQYGYTLLLAGDAAALCDKNPGNPSWLRTQDSVFKVWEKILSPKSPFYPSGFWHFCMALWGPLGILVFIQPYCRLGVISLIRWILPRSLLKTILGS